jgi:hypothetical protein
MQLTEEIQKLSLPQKAELYYLFRNNSELNDYINVDSASSQYCLKKSIDEIRLMSKEK